MSTLTELEDYLLGKDGDIGYLLNSDNNGKTVMLSGAWGAGKTHFWQNDIEPELSKKLKEDNKACVYVSLYGKDSLLELKKEVLFRASTEKDYLTDDIEAFGFNALSTIDEVGGAIAAVYKVVSNMNKSRRDKKGTNKLKDGGLICFDDFERKSKNIDLNDLFGFISQLAINLKCKVVIILNSDVFEGKESNVFKTVKEKTVNKFFCFEPTPKELFNSIFYSKRKDEKYKYICLRKYKTEIVKAIKETKELNARIYIQVLDNCLEWLNKNSYNQYELRSLVLITINFTKNHFVFSYRILGQRSNAKMYTVLNKYYQDNGLLEIAEYFIQIVPQISPKIEKDDFEEYLNSNRDKLPIKRCDDVSEFLHSMHSSISKKKTEKKTDKKNDKETTKENTQSESYYERLDKVFHENKNIFLALYLYAYLLNVEYGVDKEKFDEINQYVRNGVLLQEELSL